jgi:hypothetical protein
MRANKQIYILLSCWILVNGFLFYSLGIKYAIDTSRFDAEANAWLNGTFEPSYRMWYAGYITVLVICKSLFHSIYPSIFFQYILSAVATIYFYKGLQNLLKNSQIAFYATILVIGYFPLQQWNTCLLTESMFISLVLLFVWALSIENNSRKWITLIFISLIATRLRPNGGILLLSTCAIYSVQQIKLDKKSLLLFSIGIIIILFVLQNDTDMFYQFLLDSFNKGEIICGHADASIPTTYITNDSSNGSITKILHLIMQYPSKSMQLYIGRLIALWSDLRTYYSLTHNLFIGYYILFAYSMAIIGCIQYRNIYTELLWATVLYCGLNTLLVMITYADWDGRFLAPLLPMIFIWSGLGIYFSIQFLTRKNKSV